MTIATLKLATPTGNQPVLDSPVPVPTVVTAIAAASSLAACGGGSAPAATTPVVPTGATLSDTQAARFLAQASFAATSAEISSVKAKGYSGWLDEQFAVPVSSPHFDWMLAKGFADDTYKSNFSGVDNTLWRKFLSSPDSLRQRIVLALSEIFVISMDGLPVAWRGFAVAAYVDMLEQRAFGTYRELLEGVTLSCAMGVYLNMRGNTKEDAATGRVPDENYAREVMQLFTIGLNELGINGAALLDAQGKPKESYTQTNITDLARVLTGWEFDTVNLAEPSFMRKPMQHLASRFSTGAKKVLNVDIPASASGPAALKTVLDTLANHANVGPFIGRQLIQRLVCSNPSPAYVQRVATVFNNNGQGQRGDLKAVIKAVLLDDDARQPGSGLATGRLREPVQRFVQWGRTFGAISALDNWTVGNTTNPATRLGQSPMRSPSVFNFFRPGYVPPNSLLGSNNITAPEFQLCNESTVAGYLNYMQTVIASGAGDVKPNYTAELALAADAAALVDRIVLLLSANGLSAATLTLITTAVASIAGSTDAGKLNRVQAAVLLVMASPEYLVQK
jgi:uncharacterized protein (DUF1800 family)